MNDGLISRLAQPVNHVGQAYEARTNQLEAKRKQEQADADAKQRERDNDMLKVFEFAGDGYVNEAQAYAKQRGIEVPQEIYTNADFAKGLSLAGKFYGDDKQAAQKFSMAWMQNQNGGFEERLALAQQAAGIPVDPADRDYQRKIQFEKWKLQNLPNEKGGFSLSDGQSRYSADGTLIASKDARPPVSRFEAGQRAYNEVMGSGLSTPQAADQARQEALRFWDQEYGNSAMTGNTASQGLMTQPSDPNQLVSQQPVFTPSAPQQQLPAGLPQGSVMIGTSNGYPVYQAPNGERYVDDGNPQSR